MKVLHSLAKLNNVPPQLLLPHRVTAHVQLPSPAPFLCPIAKVWFVGSDLIKVFPHGRALVLYTATQVSSPAVLHDDVEVVILQAKHP